MKMTFLNRTRRFSTALFLIVLASLAMLPAGAQFIAGANLYNAVTNIGTWEIRPAAGGGVSTNVPTGQARWVTVGKDGFGVAIKSYATNAALTTNVWFTLEFSADGVNAITNNNITVVQLPRGTATNVYFTNFVLSTSATIGNVMAVRIKDVMQTNGLIGSALAGTLFVEKFQITTR